MFFLVKQKYQECYQNYHLGKLLITESGNACNKALFSGRFAFLNYHQDYYKQAASVFLQEYKEILACAQDTLNSKQYGDIQSALSNAGQSYLQINMTDSTMICLKNALKFIEHNENSFPGRASYTRSAKGVIYQLIGDAFLQNLDYPNAKYYFEKSVQNNLKNSPEVANANAAAMKLARIYLVTKNYQKANLTMILVKNQIDSFSNTENKFNLKKFQIDYLNQLGNYNEANKLLPEFLIEKNKFYAAKRKIKTIDAQTTFYNLQKDYDLNLLRTENKLRSLYLLILLGFVSMLFLILYQVWRNWRNSKRNNNILKELIKQVTEQNLNLQEALMALEQSEQENEKIMKVISHDLRSPIGAIVNLAGLLEEDSQFSNDEKYTLGLIKNSATDSIYLINDLLSREGADKFFDKEPVELDALLKYCISLLKYKAEEKKQVIELHSSSVVVNINREKIWRVTSNLITNAVKFSRANEKIKIQLKTTSDKVLISVSDNGIGIPEEIKAKIFDASSDIKRQGTSGEKSFGLGLFISKQIVEAHGGKLWFESFPEIGTTFFVELPIN